MRGRHCAAILRMLGVTETIAASLDDYVDIAARFARDPALRAAIRDKMAASRTRLYADPAPVRAREAWIEEWIEGIVRRPALDMRWNLAAASAGRIRPSKRAAARCGRGRRCADRLGCSLGRRDALPVPVDPGPVSLDPRGGPKLRRGGVTRC